ncbi:hypothetical protein PV728_01780 [Streptomyces europaeiscabiei]|uniref:hypothetical protein n=1 Tax=Streptomyces europaeiscabiei TaxID=146819 RepID=UPI0029A90F77|nr:hypothetical protein [Streptomyces europaeiscabiei]MDX3629059.1 hypothetical protein [Streptomyces europaeiscabiei]MDX3647323.1 hypothetical protein [Streptomyces europaeiscabiei]
MPNLFVSVMRTLVPLVAGLILTWAARLGLDLDQAAVAPYVTAALTAAYYLAFRGLEELAERMAWQPLQTLAGFLLGWARPPQYVPPITAPLRLQLDKAAMREDVSAFYRMLNAVPEDRPKE